MIKNLYWLAAWALLAACFMTARVAADEAAADDPFAPDAASDGASLESGRSYRDDHSAAARIEEALGEQLRTPLDFIDTPLTSIMQIVSEEYDIPVQFDVSALDAVAQSPDVEVTINVRGISLRSALELMLARLDDLTYIIDNEVLLITTHEEAQSRILTRAYRVDDLLPKDPGFGEKDGYTTIVEVITRCVARDAWAKNGTGEGEICVVAPGVMIITQTQPVHDEISRLLATIRRVKAGIESGSAVAEGDSAGQWQ